jgi:hypothetical protein
MQKVWHQKFAIIGHGHGHGHEIFISATYSTKGNFEINTLFHPASMRSIRSGFIFRNRGPLQIPAQAQESVTSIQAFIGAIRHVYLRC